MAKMAKDKPGFAMHVFDICDLLSDSRNNSDEELQLFCRGGQTRRISFSVLFRTSIKLRGSLYISGSRGLLSFLS